MLGPILKLALSILWHEKGKSLGAVGAVGFSVGLCLMQLGMRKGALESMAVVPAHSTADIWVVPSGTVNFDFTLPLDDRDIYKVLSVNGVERVEMVLVSPAKWRRDDGGMEVVEIVGLEKGATMLKPWNLIEGQAESIHGDLTVLLDRTDLDKLGCKGVGHTTEISLVPTQKKKATVVGLTEGIRTFINSPIVFTSLTNARKFTSFDESKGTALLVRVIQGRDPEEVVAEINRIVEPELRASTRSEFCKHTIRYWSKGTGVGNFFLVLGGMGILIGLGTLTMNQHIQVADHVREFAILKAMGAGTTKIGTLIAAQALLLACLGYLVGAAMALGAREVMAANDFIIEVILDPELFGWVFLGTLGFSLLASLPGLILIQRTDPELVFRN